MILVTGASGFAGGSLIRALLAQKRQARALIHHDREAIAGLPVETMTGNVTSLNSLIQACQGVDIVYHLAANISLEWGNWDEVEAINVSGTRNVVEACIRSKVRRLIHFSSIHAFNQHPFDRPVDENNPLVSAPSSPPYDRSKAAAEREVRAGISRGLDAVILNPTALVGPFDFKPSFFGQAILLLAKGRIPALVEGGFDWVDVRDVATAAITAGQTAPRGSQYLLGGHWHSVREVAGMISAQTGRRMPRLVVPLGLAYAAAPLMRVLARLTHQPPIYTQVTLRALNSNHHISHAKAQGELSYCPRPLQETLSDTLDWFRKQGKIGPRA